VAARTQRLAVVLALAAALGAAIPPSPVADAAQGTAPRQQAPVPRRIVSLVPALTEMLFAIGAGPRVVGVSSFDAFPADVKKLPRVGALLDPDTERILSLRPDLVLTYGSQSEVEAQFARAGIRIYSYRHGGIATVLQSLRELGDVTGQREEAIRATRSIEAQLDQVRARVRGRARPRTLLVFGREPKTLREVYASGGTGFLHEMLDIAGGENVFTDVARESVQPSTELLLTRAPEVVLEIRGSGVTAPQQINAEKDVWRVLPSIPAVRTGRIYFITADYLVVPGPRLAQGVEAIARALHPAAFK
jgi:iron complex transport system substrate-binding protein